MTVVSISFKRDGPPPCLFQIRLSLWSVASPCRRDSYESDSESFVDRGFPR